MNLRVQMIVAIGVVLAMAAFAQPNATLDTPFQVRYAANVDAINTPPGVDSIVNVTNTGFTNAPICVNVYVFDADDEQLVECCGCVITPNGNKAFMVREDLLANNLTPGVPASVVVKLLATTNATDCNAATPGPTTSGMAAYMATNHLNAGAYSMTETPFTPASPGAAELARISALCGFIQANGSGYGVCAPCRPGALGAEGK